MVHFTDHHSNVLPQSISSLHTFRTMNREHMSGIVIFYKCNVKCGSISFLCLFACSLYVVSGHLCMNEWNCSIPVRRRLNLFILLIDRPTQQCYAEPLWAAGNGPCKGIPYEIRIDFPAGAAVVLQRLTA